MNDRCSAKSFLIYQAVWLLAILAAICLLISVQREFNFRLICDQNTEEVNFVSAERSINCDPMAFTGIVTTFFGLIYSLFIDRSQYKIVRRLHENVTINVEANSWRKISRKLSTISCICQILSVIMFVTFTICGYYIFYEEWHYLQHFAEKYPKVVILILTSAILVGARCGRVIGNSFTGSVINIYSTSFRLQIQHTDQTGGLSYIGNFYLAQSSSLLIPIIWLTSWIYIASHHMTIYKDWISYFVIVIPVLSILFILCFFSPLLSFRRFILDCKSNYLNNYIKTMQYTLRNMDNKHYYNILNYREIHELSDYLSSTISMPNWPISPTVKRTFLSIITSLLVSLAASIMFEYGGLIMGSG